MEFLPQHVYIVGTMQNKSIAKRLKHVLESHDIKCTIICSVNAFEISSIIAVCEDIHNKMEATDEIMYNVTGGTKIMAVGAFIVAQRHDARIIYTNSDEFIDLRTYQSEKLHCKVDSKTIFALQGQTLKNYEIYQQNDATLSVSHTIMEFVEQHKKIFEKLGRLYRSNELRNGYYDGTIHYSASPTSIRIEKDDAVLLDINHPEVRKLLLEGRWWEVLVADAIDKWSGNRYEIWTGVTFQPKEETSRVRDKDKNEIDILVNIGNKLLFVECKSGYVNQDNINKMGIIRQNYGSDKSYSVLLSYYPILKDIGEKSREAKLNVVCGTKDKTALQQIPERFDKIITGIKA
ncbi:MAG: DUF1887 family CARF protein [Bacteroidales bacterium]|nr:DUF1887 family CARF protein [Bacteroidales bacterium]MCM1147753.1 DUF1887 family CARF protein [Bacteroidales bacterium]MCM1206637.1 DUF1887 family CARF protein [Bacillota bacterium]MCM1510622.1 DUF1887 family CARF protein [Clostridium sp.]